MGMCSRNQITEPILYNDQKDFMMANIGKLSLNLMSTVLTNLASDVHM